MKNTGSVLSAKQENKVLLSSFLWKPAILVFMLFVPAFAAKVLAQACPVKISNNQISLKRAVCVNTAGLLEGTTPSGGNGTYHFQWEIAQNNCGENSFVPITGATKKDYTIPTGDDVNACYRRVVLSGNCTSESNKIKVKKEDLTSPVPPATTVVQPLCGSSTGTITVTNPSPSAGITYSIDGMNYTNTAGVFTGLQPKVYTVSVKYPSGCISPARNDTIKASSLVSGSISPGSATICSGGSVKLTVSGGTSYQWYRNGSAIHGATAATYTASEAGNYTADILVAACKGKATNQAVVKEAEPIKFAVSTTQPNCSTPQGSLTVSSVSGGSGAGYLYSKNNGTSYQKEASFSALAPGEYQVVVKDGAGCTSSAVSTVIRSAPGAITVIATASEITCTDSTGSVTIEAKGGTSPYQYQLNGGAFQAGNIFTGLVPGNHKAAVKDAAGCVQELGFTIKQAGSTLSAAATVTNATCKENGKVAIKADGGTTPYNYSLDGGSYQTSSSFPNLRAGLYKVAVKDAKGCRVLVAFEVKQSGARPTLVVTNPPAICAGSTLDLRDSSLVKGSDKGLVYSYWKDSTASTAVGNPAAATAGTYYIKATNAEGCNTIKPVLVTEQSTTAGRITASGPTVVCFNQTLTLTASSGTGYQWYRNDGAIPGATAATYQPITSGHYSVVINNGTCKVQAANMVPVQFQSCSQTPETTVAVPTAFTPNRNGANDVLRPVANNIASIQYFKVYNRWGQMVFETTTVGKGWDGTINGIPQPADSYSWILACTDHNGNVIKQNGRSLLIR